MNNPLLLVDADSLLFSVGWTMQEEFSKDIACSALDAAIGTMRAATGAEHAIICVGSNVKCFRYHAYRYAPYKGSRPEKPEYYQRWEPVFTEHLQSCYQSQFVDGLEADDLVAFAASICRTRERDCIICSPDKDMKQIPGYHYNFQKAEKGAVVEYVSIEESTKAFWNQVVCGDTSDNIKGIPGIGPDKCRKLFLDIPLEDYPRTVKLAYIKYFGDYYGPIIFTETVAAIQLISTNAMATWSGINTSQLAQFERYVERKIEETNTANVFSEQL